ncbi:hypothetical protein CNECB9_3480005 [Cupriavidus necator]|uniref:Transposase n=1 Tax=Cupriavidus necator TaxID=106590 RepID=A0A1K0JCI8_CUPNE|nr:hypothetical protein CNECB9_3480005 [Cupriavidus necator]
MLNAIVAGEDNPERLAALAQGNARKKVPELREALRGRITAHHRTLLKLHLDVINALEHTLAELDATLGKALAPIRQCVHLLTTILGVSDDDWSRVIVDSSSIRAVGAGQKQDRTPPIARARFKASPPDGGPRHTAGADTDRR